MVDWNQSIYRFFLGEAEEAIPLDALADEKLVLKKDAEELGDVRQGEINTPKVIATANSYIFNYRNTKLLTLCEIYQSSVIMLTLTE